MTIRKPSVIVLDIETSPIIGYAWRTWDTNLLGIIQPSQIMSVAWKELGEDKSFCKILPDYTGYKGGKLDDKKLVKEVWDVLDKADVVVAHHGKRFDLPKLNSRFIFHGLDAPSSYKILDTKAAASKYFAFDSNSLNNLGHYFGVGEKIENGGFSLWEKCMGGDLDAWELMRSYNVQDVLLLEKVYYKLRPYIANHPNLALIAGDVEEHACPSCQSHNVQKRGLATTRTGTRQRYQCRDCGSWSTGSFKRNSTVLSVADA